VVVYAPELAVPKKIEAMRALGAEVRLVKGGYELAEETALRVAHEQKQVYVSAYNDGQVIAGQGTIGSEIAQDLPPEPSIAWVVPVGGGGLIAGIGAALANHSPRPRLVGVQPVASAFMHSLYFRGTQENVPDLPTLADGLAGSVEANSLTIPLVKQLVDDILVVSEEEIGHAVAFAWFKYHEKIEGSAAAALAAVLTGKIMSPAIIVISGGNIQPEVHDELCRQYKGRQ
jgi:threonine dehydratase